MGRVSTCQKNCKTIDLRGAQVNKIVDHSDVAGASSLSAASTASSFSNEHLAS